MKRCPQCNRVETDEALKFCRVDGATLVRHSSSIDQEAGTVKLAPGSPSGDVTTGPLPHSTNDEFSRATAATTVLPSTPAQVYTGSSFTVERRPNAKALAVIGILLVAIVVTALVVFSRKRSSGPVIQAIAVMPFVNDSGNAELDYLSDGMTETLIRNLSQLPNLNVKARSSVFRYKGRNDTRTIGSELGVPAILNGRFTQRGDQLTLNLELIDAQTENVIWTDQYNRKSSDLVSLQNQIARDVTGRLKIQLTSADQLKLAKNYTNDPEVYRLYLQGRFYWNKRTASEVEKAIPYFKQAVEKDPKFALGYVGLADSEEDRDRPIKKEYIRKALEIDDNLAEAHASLGYQYMVDYDWAASERELKRSMELNPNYAQAYGWNGARLMMLGKYDESLAAIQRGLELDPTSNGINFYKAVCLGVAGRRDEAIQQFKKLIQMDPAFSWPHGNLARVYRLNGDYAAAVEERAIAAEIDGRPEEARRMRDSFAKSGWDGYRRLVRESDFNPVWAGTIDESEKEKWMTRLMRQAEKGNFWLFLIKTDPTYDPLRGDPRFQALVKKFEA